ncbi:MAG: hypothetical protein AXW12_18050 [Thalassospira sp. Nap_22]|nr:MAG: hypothetical protein AXW12_18050 [Thalassospira sp. Nap_22]MDF1762010.1 hypothetical protein [Thalassolituus sp.]
MIVAVQKDHLVKLSALIAVKCKKQPRVRRSSTMLSVLSIDLFQKAIFIFALTLIVRPCISVIVVAFIAKIRSGALLGKNKPQLSGQFVIVLM